MKNEKLPPRGRAHIREERTALFIPDFSEPYPLYRKVLDQYFSVERPQLELLIYISKQDAVSKNLDIIYAVLQQYAARDCSVILQEGEDIDEHRLFQYADYFVTTREPKTVFYTCLADLYETKILYGTDEPVFPAP